MGRTVLVTRPEQDAQEIAELIRGKGYNVQCEAFLSVVLHDEAINDRALEPYDALIFTSKNGVRAFCHNSSKRNFEVYVVGDATAQEAYKNKFKNVHSAEKGGGDVASLKEIIRNCGHSKLLYLRGKHVTQSLENNLIDEKILYHTEFVKKINKNILKDIIKGKFSDILFYSVRTADAFMYALKDFDNFECLNTTRCLCLGDSIAKVVSVLPWRTIDVVQHPRKQNLLNLLD
jgi:uroporphyrinogen-III synthase